MKRNEAAHSDDTLQKAGCCLPHNDLFFNQQHCHKPARHHKAPRLRRDGKYHSGI